MISILKNKVGHLSTCNVNKYIILILVKASKVWSVRFSITERIHLFCAKYSTNTLRLHIYVLNKNNLQLYFWYSY